MAFNKRRIKPARRIYSNPELAKSLLAKLVGQKRTLYGVPLTRVPPANTVPEKWMVDQPGWNIQFDTAREAVCAFLAKSSRKFGHWFLRRTKTHWHFGNQTQSTVFFERPTRKQIADAIRQFRSTDSTPSYARSNTLGWRTWIWDRKHKCLKSPSQGTLWHGPDLIADNWIQAEVVRGHGGIHACRLPRGDWKTANKPHDMPGGIVVGTLERYGKFVLGEVGWRAEMVVIRELLVPNEAVAQTLRRIYPEVVVHVAHSQHWLHHYTGVQS